MAATFPLEGAVANLYSIASTGTDLIAMLSTAASTSTGAAVPYNIEIAVNSDTLNVTAQGASSKANRVGLRSWEATIRARYPQVQRKIGITGEVKLSTVARSFVRSWSLHVEAPALDITSMQQTDATWRYFRPSALISWSGSFESYVDANTQMTTLESPATALASYADLDLHLCDEGTAGEASGDPALGGKVFLQQLGHTINMADSNLQIVRYSFMGSGDLTATSGTTTAAIFPAGPVVMPKWSTTSPGTPDVLLTFYVDGTVTRKASGNGFWKSVDATASADGLIDLTVRIQGTGPLTFV